MESLLSETVLVDFDEENISNEKLFFSDEFLAGGHFDYRNMY